MTPGAAGAPRRGPARHERPAIDEAALIAARAADRLLDDARARGATRWITYLEPLPDHLRAARVAHPNLRRDGERRGPSGEVVAEAPRSARTSPASRFARAR